MPHRHPWPRISIVTPSYNQGQFIEETIRSVLLQGYPDLEYIVIDGGSKDNSVEMIEKYGPWLTYWVSESDRGQSHAINKGFRLSSGEVMAWINSDDVYAPGAFCAVATHVLDSYVRKAEWDGWMIGRCLYWNGITNEKKETGPDLPPNDRLKILSWRCPQRSSFWSRACWDRVGELCEDFHFVFDTEFFLRIVFSGYQPDLVPKVLAVGRIHPDCKTFAKANCWGLETLAMYERFANFLDRTNRRQLKRAVRADLARVEYHQARTVGRWLAATLAAIRIFRFSPPWNRQKGLPI